MTNSIHHLFKDLLTQWLESGVVPRSSMEGIAPEFAQRMAIQPEEPLFDSLLHMSEVLGWKCQPVEFNDMFDGPLFFYVPTTWSEIRQNGPAATFGDTATTQQSLFLIQKSQWQPRMSRFFEESSVVAFAYNLLYPPHYYQWIFVVGTEETTPMWTFAAYSAGDWLVVVKGNASSASTLKEQLTSLINSNPWYGWIEAAKVQLQ